MTDTDKNYGSLCVVGTGEITIVVGFEPTVYRWFTDPDPEYHGCGTPPSPDTLAVRRTPMMDGSQEICISWVVASVRNIRWQIERE